MAELREAQCQGCAQWRKGVHVDLDGLRRLCSSCRELWEARRAEDGAGHLADVTSWRVTVNSDRVVQVNAECLCGDVDCTWVAATYDVQWFRP